MAKEDYNSTVNHYLRAVGVEPTISDERPTVSPELAAVIKKGWRATWTFLFEGPSFSVARLAKHHRRAIKWHWNSRHRIARGGRPRYYADFPIFPRGHGKSTLAKRIAVMDAVISLYYQIGGYCLYFSGTEKKIEGHSISIDLLLKSDQIKKHTPALAEVRRAQEGGRSLGWKATFFFTKAGYVFHFGSLESGMAGANVEDVRPTLMIPDDIDNRKNSPIIAQKNFDLFTTEILPMGKTGTLTFFAQNLINRFSVMYRIYKGLERVLTNRRPSKPIPAIIGLKTEVRTVKGTPRDVIVAGTPTWELFGIEECQEEIDRFGLASFEKECQHNVELSKIGLILHNYDDFVHVISESEFASVYGSKDAWKRFNKWSLNDYARTKTARHANVAGYLSVSSQNTALPGMTFIHPISFPAATMAEDVAERLLSMLRPYAYKEDGKEITWAQLRKNTISRSGISAHAQTKREENQLERAALARIIPKYSREVLRENKVAGGVMSHSEDTIREIYNYCYGFGFQPSNPGMLEGVDDMISAAQVDYALPHPFRPEQMGYARWYVIAPDDTDAEPRILNGRKVYPPLPFPDAISPDELHDAALFRYQMSNWRIKDPKLTEAGEKIDEVLKINDDFGQMLQMFYIKKLLSEIKLTEEEETELTLPRKLQKEVLEQEAREENISDKELADRQIKRELVLNFENPLRQGTFGQSESKTKFWGDKF